MQTLTSIKIHKQESDKAADVDFDNLVFGQHATDHMFITEYENGGWVNPRIEPFRNLTLSPFALALHYGQTVFEGMKAFKRIDGSVGIFRPDKHYRRFIKSLERMCMPEVTHELFMEALTELIKLDSAWVPCKTEASLYIRPFMFATESKLGVKIAEEYIFMIVACPVNAFYSRPLKVKVETEYVRAAEGGTGYAKCGGNYGGSYYPAKLAHQQGFDQVIWTDAVSREFIEESGTMNVMFIIDGVIVTPPLSSSILDGVTRDSILQLAEDMGIEMQVRRISHKELAEAFESGKKVEAFGTGTAAVVAPIESIQIGDTCYQCNVNSDSVMFDFRNRLNAIRTGEAEDKHGWVYTVRS